MKLLLLLLLVIPGCASRTNLAPIPKGGNCHIDVKVYVPPGCYQSEIPNGIEIRCHDSTTIYKCVNGVPRADPSKAH